MSKCRKDACETNGGGAWTQYKTDDKGRAREEEKVKKTRGILRDSVLQDEGQDGRAERGIVAELLQVAAVFSFGPHGHLNEAHQREEGHGQTLGHQSEAQPRAQLRLYTHTHKRANSVHVIKKAQ